MRPAYDEPELVAATRAGDDRAFEELYARYQERIFAFILSRVHDHGRAEDIAQDVFMSALRRMRAGDQEIAFKPWIYEIAKNACIDEYRRGHRSREVPLQADPELAGDGPAMLSLLPTPVAAVESKQRMDDLRGAFGGLSDTHHRLLVLREFEGLSYDEIGDRLDMTRQMVESGLFRARRKLSEEYQELASGRRCEQVQVAIDAGVLASARALGLRDRRRFARHLSHCQACRHVALQAGVDEALVRPRSVAAKIAALLPFPLARIRWPWGRGPRAGRASAGAHQLTATALQNAPVVADQASGPALALGPAAVAAAALAIAGVGGGLLHNAIASGHTARPAAVTGSATAHHVRLGRSRPTGSSSAGPSHAHGASLGGAGLARAGSGAASTTAGAPRGHHPSAATPSASGSRTAGAPSRTTALPGASKTATGTAKQVTSGLGSSAQHLVSSTTQRLGSGAQRVVSGAGGAVGKVAGGVTTTVGKVASGATTTAGKVAGGVTNTASKAVQGTTNAVQQVTSPGSSSGSGQGTTPSPASAVSNATQPVHQAVGQVTQAVGQVVPGLPH
jgi:RNA polymerase sigma factor (sigma-70 family)